LASTFGFFLIFMGGLFMALGYANYFSTVNVRGGILVSGSTGFYLGVILIISGAAILVIPAVARRLGE
jgi:uncharacterized membrane protein YidH (DUF202 family)